MRILERKVRPAGRGGANRRNRRLYRSQDRGKKCVPIEKEGVMGGRNGSPCAQRRRNHENRTDGRSGINIVTQDEGGEEPLCQGKAVAKSWMGSMTALELTRYRGGEYSPARREA